MNQVTAMNQMSKNQMARSNRGRGVIALLLTVGFLTVLPAAAQVLANDDSFDVNQGDVLSIAPPGVLINDGDPARNPLTAILVSGPANAASFVLNADGSFSYDHDGTASATDTFTYQASNGSELSNVATVTINVTVITAGPEAVDDTYGVDPGGSLNVAPPGVLVNDVAGAGGALTAVLITPPSNHVGVFTLNSDGSFFYQHDGVGTTPDTFTYQAVEGGVASPAATVTIQVGAVGPTGANLTVHFTNLKISGHSSSAGTVTDEQITFEAPASEPALVSGSAALPPTTFKLEIAAADSAAWTAIFGSCEKLALIAQSRSDKYDLTVIINLSDAAGIVSADSERIFVRLDDSTLECSLDRIQDVL